MGKGSRSPRSCTLQHSRPPANSTEGSLSLSLGTVTQTPRLILPLVLPRTGLNPSPHAPLCPPPQGVGGRGGAGQGRRPSVPREVLSPSRGAGHTHLPSVHPAHQDSVGQHILSRKPPAGASGRQGQAQGPPGPASCFPTPTLCLTSPSPAQSPPYLRGHVPGPQRHLKPQTAPAPRSTMFPL